MKLDKRIFRLGHVGTPMMPPHPSPVRFPTRSELTSVTAADSKRVKWPQFVRRPTTCEPIRDLWRDAVGFSGTDLHTTVIFEVVCVQTTDNSAYVSIGAGDRFGWPSTGLLLLHYPCAAS
jgi:hypothetical protein